MHGWLQDELQRADEPERERMRRSDCLEGGRHTEHVGLVTQFCARGRDGGGVAGAGMAVGRGGITVRVRGRERRTAGCRGTD